MATTLQPGMRIEADWLNAWACGAVREIDGGGRLRVTRDGQTVTIHVEPAPVLVDWVANQESLQLVDLVNGVFAEGTTGWPNAIDLNNSYYRPDRQEFSFRWLDAVDARLDAGLTPYFGPAGAPYGGPAYSRLQFSPGLDGQWSTLWQKDIGTHGVAVLVKLAPDSDLHPFMFEPYPGFESWEWRPGIECGATQLNRPWCYVQEQISSSNTTSQNHGQVMEETAASWAALSLVEQAQWWKTCDPTSLVMYYCNGSGRAIIARGLYDQRGSAFERHMWRDAPCESACFFDQLVYDWFGGFEWRLLGPFLGHYALLYFDSHGHLLAVWHVAFIEPYTTGRYVWGSAISGMN